jgi:hypothetical protein
MKDTWHKNIGAVGAWGLVQRLLDIKPGFRVMDPPPSAAGRAARAAWESEIVLRARAQASAVHRLWLDKASSQFEALGDHVTKLLVENGKLDTVVNLYEAVSDVLDPNYSSEIRRASQIRKAEIALQDKGNHPWDRGTCAGAAAYFVGLAHDARHMVDFESTFLQACVLMAMVNAHAANGKTIAQIEQEMRPEVDLQANLLRDLTNRALQAYLDHPAEVATKLLVHLEGCYRLSRNTEVPVSTRSPVQWLERNLRGILENENEGYPVFPPTRRHPTPPPASVQTIAKILGALTGVTIPGGSGYGDSEVRPSSVIAVANEKEAEELQKYMDTQTIESQEHAEKLANDWVKTRRWNRGAFDA